MRRKLAAGALPWSDPRFYHSYSLGGRVCQGCGQTPAQGETAWMLDFDCRDRSTIFHLRCLAIWEVERAAYLEPLAKGPQANPRAA